MKPQSGGVGPSLAGVAVLAACACGSSAKLAGLDRSYGGNVSTLMIHPLFLAVGAGLILFGLWRREHSVPFFALIGLALLGLGEFIVAPMSITASTHLSPMQLLGLSFSIVAAAVLVFAFYRAYPSKHPAFALTAMTGAAMATGCECCLVTMGIVGTLQTLFPSAAPWLAHTEPVYIVAVGLMIIGLARLGGPLPAFLAVAAQGWAYYWLGFPYAKLPAIMLHGVNVNFVIKYPMMLAGTLGVMAAFALAYRAQESRVADRIPERALAGD